MSRPVRAGAVAVTLLLAGCGVRHGEQDWARATAATCASTIARAGLPPPTPLQIAPERFIQERHRLLNTGARFNTVTPYKDVCSAIRDEIRRATTVPPGSTSVPGPSSGPQDSLP